MKILSGIILAATLFTYGYAEEINYRPYISTRLAKAIMLDIDEVVVEEKCDGSGWITHGDGHKTECPGCSACQPQQNNDPNYKKSGFLRKLFPLFKRRTKIIPNFL